MSNYKDIYTKNAEDDTDYVDDLVDITSELDGYLNQIRNLFSAEEGSIMGALTMGIGIDAYLFDTSIPAKKLETIISTQIASWCTLAFKFKTQVKVQFIEGSVRDIVFISVYINDVQKLQFRIK